MIFVDSSAFIALSWDGDQFHQSARNFARGIDPKKRLLTSNFVLAETITYLNRHHGPKWALTIAEEILSSLTYRIIDIDRSLFRETLRLLRKFSDKGLSFTDLSSFAIMRQNKINQAFTFDRDFLRAGFEMVPGH